MDTNLQKQLAVIKPGMNWKAASKFIHNFQLKLLDTAVTLKNVTITESGIHEQVKLNKQYNHAKFDIYQFIVSDTVPVSKFSTSLDTRQTKTISISNFTDPKNMLLP